MNSSFYHRAYREHKDYMKIKRALFIDYITSDHLTEIFFY